MSKTAADKARLKPNVSLTRVRADSASSEVDGTSGRARHRQRLEEHAEALRSRWRKIDRIAYRHRNSPGDRRPEGRKQVRIGGFDVDGVERDRGNVHVQHTRRRPSSPEQCHRGEKRVSASRPPGDHLGACAARPAIKESA
jgi:hypothetical protein